MIPAWEVLASALGLAGLAAVLAACGVLRVQLARPTGAQRQAWREAAK
ncbi:MAG: hypothetical protein JWO67_1105 [Streptosporangiaceae bacterium]|nr:hypothetical protein [Streptosporangiaceae bacterium]